MNKRLQVVTLGCSKNTVDTEHLLAQVGQSYEIVPEGVEEPEQLDTLRSIGCDYIQGFLWGRPMSPENATSLVMESMKA